METELLSYLLKLLNISMNKDFIEYLVCARNDTILIINKISKEKSRLPYL